MPDTLTTAERSSILSRIKDLESLLYPPQESAPELEAGERARLRESLLVATAEYFDRLPRVVMSVCPHTGRPLTRTFDPFGLDGPWWQTQPLVKTEEPVAPASFKVLLGALNMGARSPVEVVKPVIPGPAVPFVVPRLLELPGMIAVIHRLSMHTGDTAFAIAYFSTEPIPARQLHQHWLRQDLWFKTESGASSWLAANDTWDFDLEAWIAGGKLRWVGDGEGKLACLGRESGRKCPYVGLPGDQQPQELAAGKRELLDAPSGEPFDPFAD